MNDKDLIKAYCKAAARESSDLPFGAEARRMVLGDELLARGITELYFVAFKEPFKVRGSSEPARKIDPDLATSKLIKHWV